MVARMTSDSVAEFALVVYDGNHSFAGPTTVAVDSMEIRWTNPKTSGCIGYHEIATIELNLGEPDGDDRDDCCIIKTAAGLSLKVYCETRRSALERRFRSARRAGYRNFVELLHQRLGPEDRRGIEFKTDGKLTPKAERLLAGEWLIASAVLVALLIWMGHPMALCFGFAFVQPVYWFAICQLIPKEPRTYCPEPIDEKFLPR